MNNELPPRYLKLCQISNDNYIEDCSKNVLLNNIVYPAVLQCEVIDWESEDEFAKRGKGIFHQEEVTINEAPANIREAVYQQLLLKYPSLNI